MKHARVLPLDAAALDRLHPAARSSVFWELDPLSESYVSIDSEIDKSTWLLAQAFDHTVVGYSIVDGSAPDSRVDAYATVLMCPPSSAPGAVRLPTAPFSADAFCLTSLHIDASTSGLGWEAVLLDAAVVELTQRNMPAVEAFGLKPDHPTELSGICRHIVDEAYRIGLMTVPVLESAGFRIIADHPVVPRLRLDLPPENELLTEREIAELLATVPAGT